MSTFPQTQPTKGSDSQAPASAGRGRPSRVRYRPWNQGSRRALAMLRLFPVEAAPLPRVHLEAAGADSGLQVFDRPTGQRLLVYTPRFNTQFQAGHRAGRGDFVEDEILGLEGRLAVAGNRRRDRQQSFAGSLRTQQQRRPDTPQGLGKHRVRLHPGKE